MILLTHTEKEIEKLEFNRTGLFAGITVTFKGGNRTIVPAEEKAIDAILLTIFKEKLKK